MTVFNTSLIVGVAVSSISGAAMAFSPHHVHLSPGNTSFQLEGRFTLFSTSTPQSCKIILTGMTFGESDQFNSGAVTGATSEGSGCKHIVFSNFPYQIILGNTAGGGLANVTYSEGQTTCIGELGLTVSKRGVWSLNQSNSCGVIGSLKSTPTITIVKTQH